MSPYAQHEQFQLLSSICTAVVDLLVCISLRAWVSLGFAFVFLESSAQFRLVASHATVPLLNVVRRIP